VALVIVLAPWRPWQMASIMASCTGFPRASGCVLVIAGVIMEPWAQRAGAGGNGAGGATTWPGAFWSVPVHALSCACTFWARLGVTFLVHVVHHLVEQGVEEVQGSV
jgi:hypothetical protein